MEIIDKIVKQTTEPKQKNVLWLNPKTQEIKVFGKNGWGNINAVSEDSQINPVGWEELPIIGGLAMTSSNTQNPDIESEKGITNEASGYASVATGYATIARAAYSHTEGKKTETASTAQAAHAEGFDTRANGIYSHAEGRKTQALASYSHSEGNETVANGLSSHTEGFNTRTGGTFTTNNLTKGTGTANGTYAHAEGNATIAAGAASHAEGLHTLANNSSAHAEGEDTIASGDASHAEGYLSKASNTCSHALNRGTTASGKYSHAEGNTTIAASECQHVQGKYNVEDASGTYQFIIGNGTKTSPSNAFAIKWDGTIVMWKDGSTLELTPAKLQALLALV